MRGESQSLSQLGVARPSFWARGVREAILSRIWRRNVVCLGAQAREYRELVTKIDDSAMVLREEWISASDGFGNAGMHSLRLRACCLRTAVSSSVEGMEKYLGSGMIRGIGAGCARRLFHAFGENIDEAHIRRQLSYV